MGTLLRLTLLAPDIVEAVLDGRQPEATALPRLLEQFPTDWPMQWTSLPVSLPASWEGAPSDPLEANAPRPGPQPATDTRRYRAD